MLKALWPRGERTCLYCGVGLALNRPNQKYCGDIHRERGRRLRYAGVAETNILSAAVARAAERPADLAQCLVCDAPIRRRGPGRGPKKYCGRACLRKAEVARQRERNREVARRKRQAKAPTRCLYCGAEIPAREGRPKYCCRKHYDRSRGRRKHPEYVERFKAVHRFLQATDRARATRSAKQLLAQWEKDDGTQQAPLVTFNAPGENRIAEKPSDREKRDRDRSRL